MTSNNPFELLAIDVLAAVTGGYHDPPGPAPSSSDTGTAGLNPAPCGPQPNPQPSSSPVWVLI